MRNKSIIVFSITLLAVIAGFFAFNAMLKQDIAKEESTVVTDKAAPETEAVLVVPDQAGGKNIFIERVVLPNDGFVVVYKEEERLPENIIGVSNLISVGEKENFLMDINEEVVEGDVLFAALYLDDGDGIFDAGKDMVAETKKNEAIVVKFDILSDGALENEVKL